MIYDLDCFPFDYRPYRLLSEYIIKSISLFIDYYIYINKNKRALPKNRK